MSIAVVASLFWSMLVSASAGPVQPAAPHVRHCDVTNQRDLGAWDDALVCNDQDMIVLRRGEALYSLSMIDGAAPKEMTKALALADARIVACAPSGENLWLFFESTKTAPFAIVAHSGKVSAFEIPGLTVPGSHASGIQSHVIVRHADAVILMISGGDRQTWPRDGNRPVYFWMSLKSGSVVRFPVGWDLDYFSRDQRIAVFEKPQQESFQRRPLQAVDMETGEQVEATPGRGKEGYVAFNWTETEAVKPLYMRTAETGDRERLAGISLNERVLTFNLHLEPTLALSKAREVDGFVGFRVGSKDATVDPGSLWLLQLEDSADPVRVATDVIDFAMLKSGNCVFTTTGHGSKGLSSEAFFCANGDNSVWNVLDGVQRLPDLEREVAEKDFVEDKLTVRLIEGFGTRSPIALCLFQHVRGDMRAGGFSSEGRTVKWEFWSRAVVVTSEGERYITKLYREGKVPQLVWLHNSGLLITGFTENGQMHLSACALQLAHEPQ